MVGFRPAGRCTGFPSSLGPKIFRLKSTLPRAGPGAHHTGRHQKTHHSLGLLRIAVLAQLAALPAAAQAPARTESPSLWESVGHAFHDTQTSGTYYRNSLSNSTTRDPDRPKYAGNFSQSWLSSAGGIYRPKELARLDIGLETRLRYEYRDNDLRSLNQLDPKSALAFDRPTVAGVRGAKKFDQTDHVFLQRTRLYLGVKDLLDPFRFAAEIADSRRYGGTQSRPVPNGDEINSLEPIRLYGELYFKDLLGQDPHGNARPLSLRYGIHNFEFLDRRIIANNQWRNTANTFRGFHGSLGQESNDWQIDLLAIQPLKRFEYDTDRVIDPIWVYGVIGHWRKWSEFITLEPFYFQRRNPYYIDSSRRAVADRLVHAPGLRAYGQVGETGFDFDASFLPQFGHKGDLPPNKLGSDERAGAPGRSGADRKAENIRALGYTTEVGYTLNRHPWKPRLSLFYGFASGDKQVNPTYTQSPAAQTDLTDNRFERFYGFQRPWSAQGSIVFENISAPKVRLEFRPLASLRVDLGYSWFWLASGSDRYYRANAAAGTARDYTEQYGKHLGNEADFRARYAYGKNSEIVFGYSYFKAGTYTEKNIWSSPSQPNQRGDSNFLYLEISHKFL